MHPILFELGSFKLRAFGVMMALGFLVALYAMRRLSRRGFGRLTDDHLSRLLVWLMLGGVIGARLAYVAEHWQSEFVQRPGAIIRIDQGGLMFYGGVVGAIVAIFLFARFYRQHALEILDLCAVALPLGHAFGRIGCFLNGCCYGSRCDGMLAVRFPKYSLLWHEQLAEGLIPSSAAVTLPVVPVQLIEMFANLIVFGILFTIAKRHPYRGLITALYLMLYAVVRFCTEMLRGDPRLEIGALSISQVISLTLFLLGVVFLSILRFSRRHNRTVNDVTTP